MTRTTMNSSIILVARHNRTVISENMIKKRIEKQCTYWVLAFGNTNGVDGTKMVLQTECSKRRHRRWYTAAPDLDGGRAVTKIFKQLRRALPKNLIRLLPMQDTKGERFQRPATRIGKTLTRIRLILVKADRRAHNLPLRSDP